MASHDPVSAVVFDLGGVLLELNNPIKTFGLSMSEPEFHERWLQSPSVREFERGAASSERFARSIVAELALRMQWQEFLERFDAWPRCLFADSLQLLDGIPSAIRRGLLSNTNAVHWGRHDISGRLAGRFDREFLSFETGLLKPDRESFLQVADGFDCLPQQILFFDDNPRNVSAAADAGLRSFVTRCPGDAVRVLARFGL